MTAVGARIAERGWRQGCILRDDDLRALRDRYSFDERCSADVLGLVVSKVVEQLAELIRSAGIEVFCAVALESEIAYASVRSFRRFPLEHLSLRIDPSDPMPIEWSASDRRGAS